MLLHCINRHCSTNHFFGKVKQIPHLVISLYINLNSFSPRLPYHCLLSLFSNRDKKPLLFPIRIMPHKTQKLFSSALAVMHILSLEITIKYLSDDKIDHYKAHYVAEEYTQTNRVGCFKAFSLVVSQFHQTTMAIINSVNILD